MIDKSGWGDGPWQTEPDHVAFEHVGFPCIIHRVDSHGGLCGYVAVPPGHPWHGREDDLEGVSVHGGITYGAPCFGSICHVPKPGEPDDVWWLGFDMAHSGDYSPAQAMYGLRFERNAWESYKTIDYVRAECERLAEQAKAVTVVARIGGAR